MKICSKCKIKKEESEFYKDRRHSDGLFSQCKDCFREYQKTDKCKEYKREYQRKYRKTDKYKERQKEYMKDYSKTEKYKAYQKKREKTDKCKAYRKAYKKTDRYKEYQKEYRKTNEWKEYKKKWRKKERDINPKYKLDCNMATAISLALKGKKAGRTWESLVGYSVEDLMEHLESKFEPWMNWDNYGEWHVDHIKPKTLFNYTNPEDEEFKECWRLKNLQPLEAIENIKKSNNYI